MIKICSGALFSQFKSIFGSFLFRSSCEKWSLKELSRVQICFKKLISFSSNNSCRAMNRKVKNHVDRKEEGSQVSPIHWWCHVKRRKNTLKHGLQINISSQAENSSTAFFSSTSKTVGWQIIKTIFQDRQNLVKIHSKPRLRIIMIFRAGLNPSKMMKLIKTGFTRSNIIYRNVLKMFKTEEIRTFPAFPAIRYLLQVKYFSWSDKNIFSSFLRTFIPSSHFSLFDSSC